MKTIHQLLTLPLAISLCSGLSITWAANYTPPTKTQVQKEKKAFIKKTASKYNMQPQDIKNIIDKIQYNKNVIENITRPFEKVSWTQYEKHFINPKRIQQGQAYFQKNKTALTLAQNLYHVDPKVITAIIGIESFYGQYKGTYNALDALGTLAFYYPKRESFFQNELGELMELSRKNNLTLNALQSSYAGALGIPQFMPSSYLAYAVSKHHPHHVDLFSSNEDAILSVANYLHKAKWLYNEPTACRASLPDNVATKKLVSSSAKPKHPLQWYMNKNVKIHCTVDNKNTHVSLINMADKKEKPDYWFVFNNFSSILRYNPRNTYAMAVSELSQQF